MYRNQSTISAGRAAVLFIIVLNVVFIRQGFVLHPKWYLALLITLPLLFLVSRRRLL